MDHNELAKALMKEVLVHADELTRIITRAVIKERNKPRPLPKLPPDSKPEIKKRGP